MRNFYLDAPAVLYIFLTIDIIGLVYISLQYSKLIILILRHYFLQKKHIVSRFTIYGDACRLSCINAKACLTGWLNAWVWVRRGRGS